MTWQAVSARPHSEDSDDRIKKAAKVLSQANADVAKCRAALDAAEGRAVLSLAAS